MMYEPFVCLGALMLFTFLIEYFTREKTDLGHPIVPEPNNLLEGEE